MEMAAQRSIAKDVILLGKLAARSAAMIEGEFRRNLTAGDFLGEMGSAHYDGPNWMGFEQQLPRMLNPTGFELTVARLITDLRRNAR